LILLWIYLAAFAGVFASVFIPSSNAGDEDDSFAQNYINCVLKAGNANKCNLEHVGTSFAHLVVFRIILLGFPTVIFCVFGLRPSLFRFWKEYFTATFKNRRLYLEFIPSFDPTFGKTFPAASTQEDTTVSVGDQGGIDTRPRKERSMRRLKRIIDSI
jgi:hypothetical protein